MKSLLIAALLPVALQAQLATFDDHGVVMGHVYAGTLYFHQRAVSRFCATEGEQPPPRCDTEPSVATVIP